MNRKNNNRAAKGRVSQNNTPHMSLTQPPEVRIPKYRQTFRFYYSGSINAITISDLAPQGWLAVNQSTASSAAYTAIIQSYKINRVRVWKLDPASLYSEVSLDWSTDNPSYSGEGNRVHTNTMGSTDPAFLDTKPPRLSYASTWISKPQGYVIMQFNSNAGQHVIDVDLSYRLIDNLGGGELVTLGTARTYGSRIGQLVYLPMNWAYANGSWFEPVGVTNSP